MKSYLALKNKNMSNLRETYNLIAEDWHKDHQRDDWWVEGTDTFAKLLPKGARVLDVGCGAGVKAKYLSAKGLKVLGLDFSEQMVEIAKREVPEAEFIVKDMNEVGELKNNFDGVFMQASLLHIPKGEALNVLTKMESKLNPGGLLYVAVKEVKLGRPEEEVVKESDYGYEYERFFSYYKMTELEDYFKALNLKIIYQNSAAPNNRWLQVIGQKGV
jgi:SAM-dependent methyltransferase